MREILSYGCGPLSSWRTEMSKFSTIISVIQIDVFRVQLSWTVLFFLTQKK